MNERRKKKWRRKLNSERFKGGKGEEAGNMM